MTKVPWKVVVLIVTILVFGFIAWLGRYEIVGVGVSRDVYDIPTGIAYRLDRWTGEVVYIHQSDARKVQMRQ